MKTFWKHIIRSVRYNLGSYLGASCIIALGIFIYIAMMDTLHNLEDQMDRYYQDYQLADVFAAVSAIPESEVESLTDIPGIKMSFGRLSRDVRIFSDRQKEIVTVHLLAYDETDKINKIEISPPNASVADSLYLGSKMKAAYGYQEGEAVKLFIQGESINFTLAGVCYSPEYIYAIPPGGAMTPDGEIYDIACIDKAYMEQLTGLSGIVNELGFLLQPGYTFDDVRYQLLERLEPYGVTVLCDRENQTSCNMLDGEIGELTSIGTFLPAMFMAISVFMLSIVLKKMIDRDRGLIGTMKAFGYRDRELIFSYMRQGIGIGLAGAVLGSVLAVPLGNFMFKTYAGFFNLPDTTYHSYLDTRVIGLVIAVSTSMYAVYSGVKGIISITPAEAMRAAAPVSGRQLVLPAGLTKRLKVMQKMGFRSIARAPLRTFVIILAIAFPFGMLSVLLSFSGVAEQMFYDQFDKVQIYDIQVSLDRYVSAKRAEESGYELAGVQKSEAIAMYGIELRHENLTEFTTLYGLNRGSELYRIMDIHGTFFEPPTDGLIINGQTAEKLHIKTGEMIEVSNVFLAPEKIKLPVKAVIDESLGGGCYIDINSMGRYFNIETAADTILLRVENGKINLVKEQLMETSHVNYLVDAKRILAGYQTLMQSMMAMMNMFSLMAIAAGIILIYHISLISIRERRIEFGTLLILGVTDKEIWQMISFEQIIYFVLGILAGIPVGFGLEFLIEKLIVSDLYTIDLKIHPRSYAIAFLISFLIIVISSYAIVRVVKRIHPSDILKERE